MTTMTNERMKTYDLVYISFFTVLIAVCSWISIPAAVPFTLQTMGVFVTVGILGGRRGTIAVLVYILLGAAGIPVFAGFKGGMGIMLSNTGGYIVGFLFSALLMWAMEKLLGRSRLTLAVSMFAGLLVCYGIGTLWFMFVYTREVGEIGLWTVLGWCVIPFLIPDILKIGLSMVLTRRLAGLVRR